MAFWIGLALFAGTIGKSAQFPLQVWLPDAMMGPTPCSALIHAATMVAAGVYLSLRSFPVLEAGGLLPIVAWIGGITAFGAATIALIQNDLKAVLAYSTISQLGYMVLGVGVGAYNPAFMHLITHAVFKACLFLSAGSVIHALHIKEMSRMGGYRKKLKFTHLAMLACTLAIAGVPLFSGFVSKDRILGDALKMAMTYNPIYWGPVVLGFCGAFLTAFYMFRMMFLTFYGENRDKHVYDHTKNEGLSWNRNIPLLILAVFTLGVFFSGSLTGQKIVTVMHGEKVEWFKNLVRKPKLENFNSYQKQPFSFQSNPSQEDFISRPYDPIEYYGSQAKYDKSHKIHQIGAILSIIIAFLGIFFAYLAYIKKSIDPGRFVRMFSWWNKALENKYYMDKLYIKKMIGKGLLPFNRFLAFVDMGIYDKFAIDGWEKVNRLLFTISKQFDNLFVDRFLVDGTGLGVKIINVSLRFVQSGKVQLYFMVIIVVLAGYVWRLSI